MSLSNLAAVSPRYPHSAGTMPVEVDRFSTIDLDGLNKLASLQTRKDRKYIVTAQQLNEVLSLLGDDDASVLETDGTNWFSYESVYFDTPSLDSYRLAATRRPSRFKVRTRIYVDSGYCVLEVKTKSRRGKTVKHRQDHAAEHKTRLPDSTHEFLGSFPEVAPYLNSLEPVLRTRYQRLTLVFPHTGTRATVDAALSVTDAAGKTIGLEDKFIVETKSSGKPSLLDQTLWSRGIRPVKVSKFSTGLAALHPELSANRWHRVLVRHFDRLPAAA